jgi:hypothetical protein
VAHDDSIKADLRKKAADLSLDCLAQLKDEGGLESHAWEYAQVFPKSRPEYEGIARKALINRAARVANDPKSTKSDLSSSLENLDPRKVHAVSGADRVMFYSNRSVLAKRLGDEDAYIAALVVLMNEPSLKADRKEAIMGEMTAYYEQKLDFRKAYVTAMKQKFSKVPEKEKEFRLGTLADLAGFDSQKHYRRSLKAGLMGDRALVVRSRLVVLAANPLKELKTQSRELKARPALLNDLVLQVYAQNRGAQGMDSLLNVKELRNQSAPTFIRKQEFYPKVSRLTAQLAGHTLSNKTDRILQRTLAERVTLLKRADQLLSESLSLRDVTSQMLALDLVYKENERIVKELAGLPMPQGLTAKEQTQYVALFKQKLKPYLMKARLAQQKQNDIWKRSPAISQLVKDYQDARPDMKPLLARELKLLNQVSGNGPMKVAVSDALSERSLSVSELQSARSAVAENPLSAKEIENLKNIETKIGHPLMPDYLQARLNRLHEGKSL